MYTISDLKRATGLSENQVRDRLWLLSPMLGNDVHRGARGRILVGDRVLAALKRMVELEREGLSPKVAQGRIMAELGNSGTNGASTSADPWQRLLEEKDARIAQLEGELSRLIEDKHYLQAKLDEALARIPALPAPISQPKLSRWQAFRLALLGR